MPAPTLSAVETGNLTELWIDVGAGLVEVGEITDLPDLPSFTQTNYEATHMKSGKVKEFKKNMRQEGDEITIVGNYVIGSAADTTLRAAVDSVGALSTEIRTPQGTQTATFAFYALYMSLKHSNPMEDRRTFTITLKPVSFPTEALAATV